MEHQWQEVVSFWVPGLPAPGGSKRAFVLRRKDGSIVFRPNGAPAVNVTDDAGQRNKDWKATVKVFAHQTFWANPLNEPLWVDFVFIMPRPKGHFRTGKNAHLLRDTAPRFPTTKPDKGKLERSTTDALTGIIWVDDALIVAGCTSKVYGEQPGAQITVKRLIVAPSPEQVREIAQPLFAEAVR